MEKDKILDKLSSMPLEALDRLKDQKLVELRQVLKDYGKAKDEEMNKRYQLRTHFINSGDSYNKAEQKLRADPELFGLKKRIVALGALKESIKLECELINNFYWKAKN